MRRVIGGEPHEVLVRAGHDVQVVHVVAGGRDAGAVVAVGDEGDVAVVDLAAQVDRAAGAAVGAVQAKALGALGAIFDLEVVDLFELALVLGVLLVLVGLIGGPVTAGGDDLAGQQVGGGDALDGQGVVVDLARAVAGAAQVDADLALGVVGDGDVAGRSRRGRRSGRPGQR